MTDAEIPSDAPDVFDLDRLRRLIELMKDHDLSQVDLRQAHQRIRLRRGSDPVPTMVSAPLMPSMAAPAAPVAAASNAEPEPDGKNVIYIKSPMVGTFYSRANPNSPSYVKVGDHVEPETTVCIIEAMKVFNEIPAETRGKIVAVLVDDEEPVEFGKPMFKLDTSK